MSVPDDVSPDEITEDDINTGMCFIQSQGIYQLKEFAKVTEGFW